MRESIHICNFGPIKDAKIEDIRPLTVFIGESASGKSTIMKVIALFRYLYKKTNIREYLKNSKISKTPFRISFDYLIKTNGLEEYVSNNTFVEYSVIIGDETYTITYKDRKFSNKYVKISDSNLIFTKGVFVSEHRNMIPNWSSKSASNKGANLGFYFDATFNDFEEATEHSKEINMDFLGVSMMTKKQNLKKTYFIVPDNKEYEPLELRFASSGIQTAIPLLTMVKYFASKFDFKDAFRRSVLTYLYEGEMLTKFNPAIELKDMKKIVHIHIEEPELSLYPSAQIMLLDDIVRYAFVEKSSDRDVGIMIATHSPYIINQLNVLLKRGYYQNYQAFLNKDDLRVYKLEDGKLETLNAIDSLSGDVIINTLDLSKQMDNIYSEYNSIGKNVD